MKTKPIKWGKEVKTTLALSDVQDEINRAREKFPSCGHLAVALGEEVGELCKALLDEPKKNVYKEAIQVAAVAIRIATEGDSTLITFRQNKGLDI